MTDPTPASQLLRMARSNRVTVDPRIAHGQPCLRGTPPREPVLISDIVDCLAVGMTVEAILALNPHLQVDDLRACVDFLASRPTASL